MLLRSADGHLLLTDFGIGDVLTSGGDPEEMIGTPLYMAPEQMRRRPVSASDIYSLACIAFELLTGAPPYTGPVERVLHGHLHEPVPPVAAPPGAAVPPAFQPVFDRALAKRPEDRFQTAGEFVRAFDAIIRATFGERGSGIPTTLRTTLPSSPAGLSEREVEVLRLVAQGLTNAQVAARLFLSHRTVEQHLRSIYNKLGVDNRAAATRLAVERGLA